MEKLSLFLVGFTFFFIGSLFMGFIFWMGYNHMDQLSGWHNPPGWLFSSIFDMDLSIPFYLTLICIIIGMVLLFIYLFNSLKEDRKS